MKTYPGLVHLNGNLLASVDLETTGRRPGYHEPVEIAIVPLDSDIRPLEGVRPFYTTIRPEHPERADSGAMAVHKLSMSDLLTHAPSSGRVVDMLVEWWQRLDLPISKNLVPLAHNWAFEAGFLKAWLGVDMVDELFHPHARDAMLYALALNDRAAFQGEPVPFSRVGLQALCRKYNVNNPNPHDALCDAIAEAQVYRSMLVSNLALA